MNIIKSSSLRRTLSDNKIKIFAKSKIKSIEEAYDWYTIFFGNVRVSKNKVLFVGPPLKNFQQHLNFRKDNLKLIHKAIRGDKLSLVEVYTEHDDFELHFKDECFDIKVDYKSEKFNNDVMISTMISDEPIEWIVQWIEYHNRNHDISSFVIFNNLSKSYTSKQLETIILKSCPYIKLQVEDTPVPYGIRSKEYSANYTQRVALEYCKQMYAWCASVFINIDIDEFISFPNTHLNKIIKNMNRKGDTHIRYFRAIGISHIDSKTKVNSLDLPPEEIHVKNYYNSNGNTKSKGAPKWMCVPKYNMNYTWGTHHCGSKANIYVGKIFHVRCFLSRSTQPMSYLRNRASKCPQGGVSEVFKRELEKAFPPEDK